MRCQVCDYSEGGALRSPFNETLNENNGHRKVRYNPITGESICDHCMNEVREYHNLWEEDEAKLSS